MKKNYHVVPQRGKWAVKMEKAERADSLHDTQSQAINRARDKNSYGNDPNPPKDKKF